ncbi:MAG: hypothetical protein WCS95_03605 [Lentisphaeria bacterium]|nr:hypothetical protein [Lentisphaeria bacterium]NLZ60324.1 hypothetical protein [Lentisphaerota bacterium]
MSQSHTQVNTASGRGIVSLAWDCAQEYEQVLLAYLVCVWHLEPGKARRLLGIFFDNKVIRIRLAEESRKAGNCYRVVLQQALDQFLANTSSIAEAQIAVLKEMERAQANRFFNQAWARHTIAEALRRVLFFCSEQNERFLYDTLLADFARIPYAERKARRPMREMYQASEKVKLIFSEQMEAVLLRTISDPRLVMQEWQELHHILPELIALDPEMATQHDLAIQDMKAFWLELLKENLPGSDKSFWSIIHNPKSTLEDLQKAHACAKSQRGVCRLPAELSEALNYACLAAEFLKSGENTFGVSTRMLGRGFFWLSKQKWLDPSSRELAEKAEGKLQDMTLVVND